MVAKCLDAGVLDKIKRQRSEAFLDGLIDLFLAEGPARLQEAWIGGRSRDRRKTAVAAHILACLADNIGAVAVRELAAAAEAACIPRPGSDVRLAHCLFDLEIAMAETRSCLAFARPGDRGPG